MCLFSLIAKIDGNSELEKITLKKVTRPDTIRANVGSYRSIANLNNQYKGVLLVQSARMQVLMDKTAIALSAACAIHCLVLPVIIVMLPALSTTFVGSESFHRLMVWFVFPISALALTQGCRRHKDRIVLSFGGLGLALLIATAIIGHSIFSEEFERLTTVSGAMFLAFGHLRNYQLCRKHKCRF